MCFPFSFRTHSIAYHINKAIPPYKPLIDKHYTTTNNSQPRCRVDMSTGGTKPLPAAASLPRIWTECLAVLL
jgi:hypothetical protein